MESLQLTEIIRQLIDSGGVFALAMIIVWNYNKSQSKLLETIDKLTTDCMQHEERTNRTGTQK